MSSHSATSRSWPAVLALAAVLAVWIDLSPIHQFHNSDSLIPVLMSLDRWTPFYWEQNRFGMLLPLLALPFRDPFVNLLAQVGLRLFALLLSFFLLARTAVPRPWWPAVGALTLMMFIAGKDIAQINFQQMQPYFQAMVLALAGLALLERGGRRARGAGAALFALAFWVAPVTLFWLVPLVGLRRLLGLEKNKPFLPLLLAGLGFGGSLLASRLSSFHLATNLGVAPPASWPRGWLTLAERVVDFLGWGLLGGLGLLLIAALALAVFSDSSDSGDSGGRARPALASALCLLGTAAAELLILGTSGWIHLNGFRSRFLASTLLAIATAGPVLLLGLCLEGRPERWGRMVNALALAALLPLTLWRFGLPSPLTARAALGRSPGAAVARAIVADGCTHVLGDYWRVWPAVFEARVLLHERGEERKVWGVAFRSTPTWDLWRRRDWRTERMAVLGSPRQIERVRSFYRIPRPGDPAGPARCASGRPVVSFRGFRPEPTGVQLSEEPTR